jgi:hypothetical protein
MVIGEKMTIQNYLIVEANVVTNVCIWDGDPNTWQPPADATMLVQATTQALVWQLNADKTDFVLVEVLGIGTIGFTWNPTTQVLTTNEPKPEIPTQPVTTGTQSA